MGDLLGLIGAGGPVLVVLLVMSVFVLAIILIKLWQFHTAQLGRTDFIDKALTAIENDMPRDAHSVIDTVKNPIARVLETITDHKKDWSAERLDEEIDRRARNELSGLRKWLRALELSASVAPLIGLLGTVIGMIEAFSELQSAGGRVDPGLLAGGISTALLTTAGGLIVAIIASVALAYFEGKIDRFTVTLEDTVVRALHHHFDLSTSRSHLATLV